MRLCSVVLGLLATGASLLPAEATACGDKFLVIGRSARRVQKARHPARVALYLRTGSALPAEAKEMQLEKTLEQAGHKVEVIPDETALREAMASRRLDFVIADLGDAPGLARGLPAAETADRARDPQGCRQGRFGGLRPRDSIGQEPDLSLGSRCGHGPAVRRVLSLS